MGEPGWVLGWGWLSPGCPCAPGCLGMLPGDGCDPGEWGLCCLWEEDATGALLSPSRPSGRLCPTPQQGRELRDLGSVPRTGLGDTGRGRGRRRCQLWLRTPVCVWPGSRGRINPTNPPRHFSQEGPLGAGSSPLAGSPPGKRSPALAGGEYLRGARPPHAGCQRPGAGPAWVRRDWWAGEASRPPAPPGWEQEGQHGTRTNVPDTCPPASCIPTDAGSRGSPTPPKNTARWSWGS